MKEAKKPEITVFAGPNGSGKSTFAQFLKPKTYFINADQIKKSLNCSDLEAAQIAERQREECIGKFKEFSFETVLSTPRNLKLLKRAKESGYFIRCYYILTADPKINIWRIKSRVDMGGHNVPEDKVITRYNKALNLIKKVVEVSDICHIYDNSGKVPRRIFKKRKNQYFYDECDIWRYKDIEMLTGVTDMAEKDLNL